MSTIKTTDGGEIFYKGLGQRVRHACSDWVGRSRRRLGTRQCCLLTQGIAVIAPTGGVMAVPRRSEAATDMDHYADGLGPDCAPRPKDAVARSAIDGGGAVVDYLARTARAGVRKRDISAVPPLMVKTAPIPGGSPTRGFDGFQAQLAAPCQKQNSTRRPAGPFYGYNRAWLKPVTGRDVENWWRQGMMGGRQGPHGRDRRCPPDDLHEWTSKKIRPCLGDAWRDDQMYSMGIRHPFRQGCPKKGHLKTTRFPQGMPRRKPRPSKATCGAL